MNLDNYKEQVDKGVLGRGREYYHSDAIIELSKLSPNHYVAMIESFNEDDRIYRVDVDLDGRAINSSRCTCPYDNSPTCKHEVAVYMAINNGQGLDLTLLRRQQQERLDKANTLLDETEEQAILTFVKEQLNQNIEFREAFINAFGKTKK